MSIMEIDENELVRLRQIEAVAGKMMNNPKAKKLLEQAHKTIDPNAITPALDQERMIQEPVNEALKKVHELQAELQKEREDRAQADKLASLQKGIDDGFSSLRAQGWQEEGIKAVDTLMKEKGILDPAIAAAYIEKSMPPQQPATPSGVGAWNFMEPPADSEADLKSLMANRGEGPVVDKMARDALNEFRGQTRR
jgi:hypothetical protein